MKLLKRLLSLYFALLFTLFLSAQEQRVSGNISDSLTSLPVEGATVRIKGSRRATLSDQNGDFNFSVKSTSNLILMISAVGYADIETPVGEGPPLKILISPVIKGLNEVVVIGYGKQQKVTSTAAVSTMDAKKVTSLPVAHISNDLGGRVSGVLFKQTSSEPGYDNADIKIRGIGTLGNSNPLVIIDGIERQLASIDPHDIQSLSILKDAASVAPFGLRGANGVILITTRRGSDRDGTFDVSYDGKIGWSRPTMYPKELSGYEWAVLKNAGALNDGAPPVYTDTELQKLKDGTDPDHYANENIMDRFFKTGKYNQQNVSVGGGNKNISLFGSLGYLDQSAMWGDVSNFKRYTIRTNIDFRLNDNAKLGLDVWGIYRNARFPSINSADIVGNMWRLNSTSPIFYSNGGAVGFVNRNPYQDLHASGYYKENFYNNAIALRYEQKIPAVPGLLFKGNFSVDMWNQFSKAWATPYELWQIQPDNLFVSTNTGYIAKPRLWEQQTNIRQLTTQLMLNYNHRWNNHGLDAIFVFEPRSIHGDTLIAQRQNYQLYLDELNMGSVVPTDITNGGTSYEQRQVGYAYRASYDYANKYMLEAGGRYDGHYYFAPNHRYAFFPSISGAWRLSEEKFLKGIKAIDNLKFRASWGKSGNLAGRPYQYLRQYNSGASYLFGGSPVMSIYEDIEPNPRITWEKASKTDVGLELSLWHKLLSIEVDYFYEKRKDMLIPATATVPLEYGLALAQENTGVMQNAGVDLNISSVYAVDKNWTLNASFNFTYAKNKILEINEAATLRDNPNRSLTGKPIGTQFGFKAVGFFQSQDDIENTPYTQNLGFAVKPGDVKYEDIDKNGILDVNDYQPIGKPLYPSTVYGFELGLAYKKIQLNILIQGATNVNYYITGWAAKPFTQGFGSAFKHQLDYWTPENREAAYPAISANPAAFVYNNYISSLWMRDGAYLRLKSASISYNIGKISAFGIRSSGIYVSGQNLLTLTKTKYIDPENSSTSDYYFQERVIALGITLNF